MIGTSRRFNSMTTLSMPADDQRGQKMLDGFHRRAVLTKDGRVLNAANLGHVGGNLDAQVGAAEHGCRYPPAPA